MRRIIASVALALAMCVASANASATQATPAPGRTFARPDARLPWLAFVLAFGGIGFGIFVISAWGAGRGPEPTLGPPLPDPHAHGDEH